MSRRTRGLDDALVTQAFLAVRQEWSADRVVCDPDLNAQFDRAYRRLGGQLLRATANRGLLNLRKRGRLGKLQPKRTVFRNQDDYEFASEIAIRFLERRDGVTLDQVICDPDQAAEFDSLAARLAPGYSPLQYRWAALSLRKNRKLAPEVLPRVVAPSQVLSFEVAQLDTSDLPATQGLYLLHDEGRYLYAGETDNLKLRLRKHLDHSDNRGLARWIWDHPAARLFVEIHVLPAITAARVRKAMERELIRSRKPEFNLQR